MAAANDNGEAARLALSTSLVRYVTATVGVQAAAYSLEPATAAPSSAPAQYPSNISGETRPDVATKPFV